MKTHHHVTKYSIQFMSLTAQTQYDEFTLQQQFYNGLPNQIKDEIVKLQVQPECFTKLQMAALQLDSYYWM
jgi:hypothetical protein